MGSPVDCGPAVHAIVITFQRPEQLRKTLGALGSQTRPPDRVMVVDNGAEDAVRTLVATLPHTTYLPMADNLGPAGAIARGMARALDEAAPDDWVLLIDDDDPPPFPEALEALVDAARDAPQEVGALGLTGARFDRWWARLRRVLDEELEGLTDVDYLGNGQMPLYRVRAIEEVGPFDVDLFFGLEELDFGLRLRAAGWRVTIPGPLTMRVRALHDRTGLGRHAPAGPGHPAWRRYYSARNLVRIARRHGHWTAPAVATGRTLLGALRTAVRAGRPAEATPALRGLVDGWRGVVGRSVEPRTPARGGA